MHIQPLYADDNDILYDATLATKHDNNLYRLYDYLALCSTKMPLWLTALQDLQGGPAKVRPTYIFDGNI